MASKKPDEFVVAFIEAATAAAEGNRAGARKLLAALPSPPPPYPRGLPRRSRLVEGETVVARRRNVSQAVYLATYFRDDFTCRYCGRYTLFLQVLKILSHLYPDEFPMHPNWKHGECHPAYWSHATSLEHVVPVARGGDPTDPGNLVTACYACQHTKGTRLLDEIGWDLAPPFRNGWDGVIRLYPSLCDLANLSSVKRHRGWLDLLDQRASQIPPVR